MDRCSRGDVHVVVLVRNPRFGEDERLENSDVWVQEEILNGTVKMALLPWFGVDSSDMEPFMRLASWQVVSRQICCMG